MKIIVMRIRFFQLFRRATVDTVVSGLVRWRVRGGGCIG